MPDWKDFTVLFCLLLVAIGAASLGVAAHSFSIIRGVVVDKGSAVQEFDGKSYPTKTILVLIENDDRVFNIKRGTVVEYAISDSDSELVDIGAEVELFVSSNQRKVRIFSPSLAGRL